MKIITYADSIDEFEKLSSEDYGDIIAYEENATSIYVHECGSLHDPKLFSSWNDILDEFIRK